MESTITIESFIKQLNQSVDAEIKKAMAEEIERAKKRLEDELQAKLGTIALSLIKNYDVYYDRGELLIRVHNDVKVK